MEGAVSSGSSTVPLGKKHLTYNAGTIKRSTNRILVTGGCGFIGSHLIDRLMQDERNEVICADNLFSGNKANIAQWLNHPSFEFLRHDARPPSPKL
jgi:nucleoside-diphosphate-sugar epimerase